MPRAIAPPTMVGITLIVSYDTSKSLASTERSGVHKSRFDAAVRLRISKA